MHPQLVQIPPQIIDDYAKKINLQAVQCMLCGSVGKFNISPIVYDIRPIVPGGGIAIGGQIPTVPVILIHCQKCGDTRFVSTVITQMTPNIIISKQPPPQDKDPLDGR